MRCPVTAAMIPVGLYLLGVCWLYPLASAVQFGSDEHYELSKAFQVSLGHSLYGQVWNDQPPFHTGVVALAFWFFGVKVLVARVVAVLYSCLLLGCLFEVVRIRSGYLAAGVAVGLMMVAPGFAWLSVSVMLEPPMLATGMLSVLLLMRASDNLVAGGKPALGMRFLLASGVVMGLALQTKLTSVIFLPAILLEILLRGLEDPGQGRVVWGAAAGRLGELGKRLGVWSGGLLFGVAAVWCFFSEETLGHLFISHFSEGTRHEFNAQAPWQDGVMRYEVELLLAGVVAVLTLMILKRAGLRFPLVLLVTVGAVHLMNRPFWPYYGIHFWLPICWLIGLATAVLWEKGVGLVKNRDCSVFPVLGFTGLWALLCALALSGVPDRFGQVGRQLALVRKIESDVELRQLVALRSGANWMFTDRPIESFHARIPQAPELAVLPLKRYASGQIDEETVLAWVETYRPEVIFIDPSNFSAEWQNYLGAHYRVHFQEGSRTLFTLTP